MGGILAKEIANGEIAEPWSYVEALEDEIEDRGLQEQYIIALQLIIGSDVERAAKHVWYVDIPDFWALIRATPEQRAQAYLKVAAE